MADPLASHIILKFDLYADLAIPPDVDATGRRVYDDWEPGDLVYVRETDSYWFFTQALTWQQISGGIISAVSLTALQGMAGMSAGRVGYARAEGRLYVFDGAGWTAVGSKTTFGGLVAQTAAPGVTAVGALPAASPANNGVYYVANTDFTVAGTGGALDGERLFAGDWLQSTGNPATGLGGWAHLPGGGFLTKPHALGIFLPDHDPTQTYEVGAIVVHDHQLWRANANINPRAFDPPQWTRVDLERPWTIGATRPATTATSVGNLWLDTNSKELRRYNGTNWLALGRIETEILPALATRADGEVLTWDASDPNPANHHLDFKMVAQFPAPAPDATHPVRRLSVDDGDPNPVVTWMVPRIGDNTDVDPAGAVNHDTLVFDGTDWKPAALPVVLHDLNDATNPWTVPTVAVHHIDAAPNGEQWALAAWDPTAPGNRKVMIPPFDRREAGQVLTVNGTGEVEWQAVTAWHPAVDIQMTSGHTPATVPPVSTPGIGDWYLNPTDHRTWVYTPQVSGPSDWTEIKTLPPRVHVSAIAGDHPDGTHYDIRAAARPRVNWETVDNPALLAAWNAAPQGSEPKVFFDVRNSGSVDVYVDNPAGTGGTTRKSDYYELRLDTAGIAAIAAGTYISWMHAPHEGNSPDTFYMWFNIDGTISIGKAGSGFARQAEYALHVMSSGDTPVAHFPLSKIGLTPADLGDVTPLPATEADEYLNTADSRSWVHDGTSWVERPAPAAAEATLPIQTMTRAAYDALGTKDPNTLYVIKDTVQP